MPSWYPRLRQPAYELVGVRLDLQPQSAGSDQHRRALLCLLGWEAPHPAETDEPLLVPPADGTQPAPEARRPG